jgi:hypothetical protein
MAHSPSRPPTKCYRNAGSRDALLSQLRAWLCERDGYDDIVNMSGNQAEVSLAHQTQREGLVYLLKSGAHYKVGRSDELERRVKEIRIALPETATLVHSIRTDDPAGIGAYWHRRLPTSVRMVACEW